jgi:hypothetical protein
MRPLAALLSLGALSLSVVVITAAQGTTPGAVTRTPRINYMLHCQGCHLPDGSGLPHRVPTMRGQLARFLAVPGGREYIVQVPGVSTSKLSDGDTAALMNWLVREMGPAVPADFRPYTAAEVTALRTKWLNRPAPVRAALMKSIEQLAPEK